jgi:acyl-CoA synthetase (AMP-forming)/AMP-acid ligase II
VGQTILNLVRHHAAQTPDAPCLSFETETLSYRDLHARGSRVANALTQQGVKAGDRVAILARNSPAHYELLFGCGMIGVILLPVNWRLAPREVADILADAVPSLLIVEDDLQGLLAEAETAHETMDLHAAYPTWRDRAVARDAEHPVTPNTPALMLYTSGTTGRPKGAVLSHDNLSYMNRMTGELWDFPPDGVNLVAMPLFHIGGIGYGLSAFGRGGHTVLMQQVIPAEIVEAIRTHRVTHGFFVPTVIQMLMEVPGVADMDLSSLKCMLYGGAPIGEAVLKRAMELFGCGFIHCYGMTETAGTVITLVPKDHDPGGPRAHRLRSCGLPMPWVELALINPETGEAVPTGEVGEIRIRSAVNMLGYWNKPEETAKTITLDGWLCTGDAAVQDADGYVYIHDRFKDMIVSGGENIYPTEIENVLFDHPGVAQVAVIGVAHLRWGETPKAFVVAREGATPSEAELIDFTRDRLAHYKCPTSVAIVSALPLNGAGKILKKEMRNPAWLEANS